MNLALEDRLAAYGEADAKPITQDHHMLHVFMTRLGDLLANLARGVTSQEGETRRVAEQFHVFLLRHLETEEMSGMLEHAAEAEPRLADRVQCLLREHGDLRSCVEDLVESASGGDWTGFRVRFTAFSRLFSSHERAENDVLMEAYLLDIGGHH